VGQKADPRYAVTIIFIFIFIFRSSDLQIFRFRVISKSVRVAVVFVVCGDCSHASQKEQQ
jgi:hypothetical protein